MSVSSAEENRVRECMEEAVALVGKAEELITGGDLPELDKSRLVGCILGIKCSIVGLNSQGLNAYAEFRPRKAA